MLLLRKSPDDSTFLTERTVASLDVEVLVVYRQVRQGDFEDVFLAVTTSCISLLGRGGV